MINIIAHLSVLSKIIGKDIKDLNSRKINLFYASDIPENDLEYDIEITYLSNGV